MSRIFISYSRVNKNIAKTLYEKLSSSYVVWYDKKLKGGDEWWAEILREIRNCDHFIYLLSPDSIASDYCQKEITEARKRKKQIIPVRIRKDTPIPTSLKKLQYIDMFNRVSVNGINQIYGAMIRNSKSEEWLQLDQKRYEADFRLLRQLWKSIDTITLENLSSQMQGKIFESDLLFNIYYMEERRKRVENHFHNLALESAFSAFDAVFSTFQKQVTRLGSRAGVSRNGKNLLTLGLTTWVTQEEYQKWEVRFLQVLDTFDAVITKQTKIVQIIRNLYPEFDFTVEEQTQ